ncbi:hypothetical protein K469DRAFT_178678 [Zopfia rhizophila CBS 207.26]|uniref:Uncharacterized protein n=1 Tax=Zopfia rhizophila CBS 207.26 TaxID=1314779 RepID=A0A6A6DYS2_9PEZI|nr:hypothetical protein K469DRAFT_178678 [Zopfia rhizophila CBS 207.26]
MCIQIIEIYSVCRCLYYKHSIDPCPYRRVRGHAVQGKTVLVGYACAAHTSHSDSTEASSHLDQTSSAPATFSRPPWASIVENTDSDEEADDAKSIFSTALVSYNAGSLITTDEDDTIDEILHMLVNDPLLDWPGLLGKPNGRSPRSCIKDVRFFLRTFESDLRIAATSAVEFQACLILRSRIAYFSSQIHKHFNISDVGPPVDQEGQSTVTPENTQAISPDELDLGFIPPFQTIQRFMFDGIPFATLRENIRSCARTHRDHNNEIVDILLKELSLRPMEWRAMSASHRPDAEGALHTILQTFILNLFHESISSKISVFDINGVEALKSNVKELKNQFKEFFDPKKPDWYYCELVPREGINSKIGLQNTELERCSESEDFRQFVCRSKAFASLKEMISCYAQTQPSCQRSRLSFRTVSQNLWLKLRPPSPPREGQTRVWFTCNCGLLIYDDFSELRPEAVQDLQKRLKVQFVLKQHPKQLSQHSSMSGRMVAHLASIFKQSTGMNSRGKGSLPQHRTPQTEQRKAGDQTCQRCSGMNTGQHKFIHVCLPHMQYATRMDSLRFCHIRSDSDFFNALRSSYHKSKSNIRMMISLKKPISLNFVKFNLYKRELVDIHITGDIPPETGKDEYEYFPMPADTIPRMQLACQFSYTVSRNVKDRNLSHAQFAGVVSDGEWTSF